MSKTVEELELEIKTLREEMASLRAQKGEANTKEEKTDIANALAKLAKKVDNLEKALQVEENHTMPTTEESDFYFPD